MIDKLIEDTRNLIIFSVCSGYRSVGLRVKEIHITSDFKNVKILFFGRPKAINIEFSL